MGAGVMFVAQPCNSLMGIRLISWSALVPLQLQEQRFRGRSDRITYLVSASILPYTVA